MRFETDIQRTAYERIAPLMKELFGEQAVAHDEQPLFFLRHGSAAVIIGIAPFRGGSDAIVMGSSLVVTDVELTLDLARYLLAENAMLVCGAWSFDEHGIWYRYSILAPSCDKEELRNLVGVVVAMADASDDELVARFGGRRATDSPPF